MQSEGAGVEEQRGMCEPAGERLEGEVWVVKEKTHAKELAVLRRPWGD